MARLLADTYSTDRSVALLFGELSPQKTRRALHAYFSILVDIGFRHGHVLGAARDGKLLGALVYFDPNAYPPPLGIGVWSLLRCAAYLAPIVAPRSIFGLMDLGRKLDRLHPRDRHYYLEIGCVHGAAQRSGIGRALIEAALRPADAARIGTYAESSSATGLNAAKRVGFQVTATATIQGVEFCSLWRAPPTVG